MFREDRKAPRLHSNAAGGRASRPAILCTAVLAALAALASGAAEASDEDTRRELLRCLALAEEPARLACYDRLANGLVELGQPQRRPPAAAAASPAASAPAAAAPVTPAPVAPAAPPPPTPARAPAPPAAAATPAEEFFGMERKAVGEEINSIRARVVGGFQGWRGDTRFELDNGQVWMQVGTGRFEYGGGDREVVIRRGVFDSFILSPEGLNRTVRVRRVE
jgi:hypothetical protein